MDDLDARVEGLGLGDRVIHAGYLSDAELRWAYEHCFAFVYPSLYEGFGLPVLEAMSLGAPVITSSVTSLPEVAGDGAIVVRPEAEPLALAMLSLRRSPGLRCACAEQGTKRAATFTWRRAAEQTLEVYRRVAAQPRFAEAFGG
jgi:glycosyltransferase involved in cell wall biosynthesis